MVYNIEKIEELLNKYFEGETSLQEEQTLKEYFLNADNVPAKWNYAKAMFVGFEQNRQTVATPAQTKSSKRKSPLWIKIAAVFVGTIALSGIIAVVWPKQEEVVYCCVNGKPVTDYNTALIYAQEVLTIVDNHLSMPTEKLDLIDQSLEESAKYIDILKHINKEL